MRKILAVVLVGIFSVSLVLAGCTQKAASTTEAIQNSKAMKSMQEQVDYLVKQANAFYNSKEYKDAIVIADYVMANLDKNSQAAQDLIEKAKKELSALAQQKLDEVKGKFGVK